MLRILIALIFVSSTVHAKQFYIELKNDDLIIGEIKEEKLNFKSDFGDVPIAVEKISEISFDKTTTIIFKNDDILSAQLVDKEIHVECELGTLKLSINKVRKISLSRSPIEDKSMQWTTFKNQLRIGIKVDKKKVKPGDTLTVYSEVINISKSDVHFPYPYFSDYILSDKEEYAESTVALIASQELESITTTGHGVERDISLILQRGAKLVFEFELKIQAVHEEEQEVAVEELWNDFFQNNLIRNKLHLKQKLVYYPMQGNNSIQLRLKIGKEGLLDVFSKEASVEYKP